MPDDVFRIVITVAVALACIAFLVQAGIAIALYRVMSSMQKKVLPVIDRADALAKEAAPLVAKVGPVMDGAGPALEAFRGILSKTDKILEEVHPRVKEISTDVTAIARSSRRQVDRIGELLDDAGSRAKERLEQIDHSVDNTVEHLEQAGEVMRRAVLRPVREVNGLAAGISAAVSTLVHGSRKSSVASATQDEEMFI